MEEILRRFCAYGMEYKDHEGYTDGRVTLLPAVQLAYNTDQNSTTGKRLHWKKNPTPPEMVEVEDSPGPVKRIIKARKIRLNGKDQRQYLVRFKNQTADKDKGLAENSMPDVNLHLRRFRASRRTQQYHK
ncbi:hypothetical protein O181_012196 [Austropuccinia psidii MF-1]|uniref:Uncharacterized protein n=1 Tax=Austropuccinia psidii MF-1 TaxID=1389203 RepID=A0A9Q3GM27_9BASI|nr:hypothetical protein [Austropuccinia psidii MF-1]